MHEGSGAADGSHAESDQSVSGIQSPATEVIFRTVPLADHHRTNLFCCKRSSRVQDFIRHQARDMVATGYSRVFVWPFDNDPTRIAGYYSLSSSYVGKQELSNKDDRKAWKGLPVPMALIGFMGRDDEAKPGLGRFMVTDAARRVKTTQDTLGIWGLFLHAENEDLAKWYADVVGFTAGKVNRTHMYGPLIKFL